MSVLALAERVVGALVVGWLCQRRGHMLLPGPGPALLCVRCGLPVIPDRARDKTLRPDQLPF